MDSNVLIVKDAIVRFHNLRGRENAFNPPGRRNFTVVVPADKVDELIDRGWQVKKRSDGALLTVYFTEGYFPNIDIEDVRSKTLVLYGLEYDVKHLRGHSRGVKAFLSGIDEN